MSRFMRLNIPRVALLMLLAVAVSGGAVSIAESKHHGKKLKIVKDLKPADKKRAERSKKQYDTGKMKGADRRQYETMIRRAQTRQKSAMVKKPAAAASQNLAGTNLSKSCLCHVTCQTIVWASNAGSYEWSAEGTVSSPSACADAAVATCGNAVASYLVGWNCK